ncbi:MAG: alkaline phosphatase family protein, partial [Acidimicrobiia bacterium]|nr:alkaline phosphatase family protein [Acidimicrobiia bacterium]
MTDYSIPDYSGGSLVNLIAELEQRLTGSAQAKGLHPHLADRIPAATTYVLMLFDGLGDQQLDHPCAAPLRAARAATLDAAFPTTTSVNLASVATGLAPATHGLIAHQLYVPSVDKVVNTLKWTTPWGDRVKLDHRSFLPAPNLWERLRASDIEPITVQPGNFQDSRLSRVLYRGCRYEPIWTVDEIIDATVQLARVPGRLIFTYFPNVDVSAHVHGQESDEYAAAVSAAAGIWERIALALPSHAVMVGTADHGHIDYQEQAKVLIAQRTGSEFYGDPRAVLVRRVDDELSNMIDDLPCRVVEASEYRSWLGPGIDHPDLAGRMPEILLLADPDRLLIPRFMDKRLTGYHGGLAADELRI